MWGRGPWLATGLLGLALVVGSAGPSSASAASDGSSAARAKEPVLSTSLDGRHWSAGLDRPLFAPDRAWVPGDRQTATLWVRDLAGTGSLLDVELAADEAAWSAAHLAVSTRIDGAEARVGLGTASRRLDPGSSPTRVDVTVSMPVRAGERAEARRTQLSVRARLTPLDVSRTSASPDVPGAVLSGLSEPVGGHLPGTGSPPFALPLVLVALVAAVRAALVGRRSPATWKVIS